jgi:hypothetical protein
MGFGALAAAILFSVDFLTLPELRWTIYPTGGPPAIS